MKVGRTKSAILLVFLLLACAGASVLVAWGCAQWEKLAVGGWTHTAVTEVPQEVREYLRGPAVDAFFGPERKSGFSKTVESSIVCTVVTYSRWHDSDSLSGYSHSQSSHRYGFPFRSMQRTERAWSNP